MCRALAFGQIRRQVLGFGELELQLLLKLLTAIGSQASIVPHRHTEHTYGTCIESTHSKLAPHHHHVRELWPCAQCVAPDHASPRLTARLIVRARF